MSQLLFSNILVNVILKSCHIPFTIQISHHEISGYFQSWRWNSVRKLNIKSEVISEMHISLKQLQEKGFFTNFEMWTERWKLCILSHGMFFEKECFTFCCKYTAWFFVILFSVFAKRLLHMLNNQSLETDTNVNWSY